MDHVAFDNVAAARTAVTHLVERDRTRIAVVGVQDSETGETARLRLAGWRAALDDAGIPAPAELMAEAPRWHRAEGHRAVQALLRSGARPDALFCCNDLLAVGALRALAEAGLRVPEDVAVVGIDDIEEASYTTPSLTTIAPDKQAIAQTSIQLLARRLDETLGGQPATEPEDVSTGFTLVVRESS
jgi:LacI family repressor for deo operon, udp, cdd, tsx, nupC, and nupG